MSIKEKIKEIVLEIRQYLCNTEFAPEPFTEPVDPDKLTIEFPNQILSHIKEEIEKMVNPYPVSSSRWYGYNNAIQDILSLLSEEE